MSIELELKLGDASLEQKKLTDAVWAALNDAFEMDRQLKVTPLQLVLGPWNWSFTLEIEPNAVVDVGSIKVGSESEFGEEGGWWVYVTVTMRKPESFALMIAAAAC